METMKVEFEPCTTLDGAIQKLERESRIHNCVCYGEFNSKQIFSTDSVDAIYKRVIGQSKYEYLDYLDNQNRKYEKEKKAHLERVPSLTLEYIERAKGVIPNDKLGLWEELVPMRLRDLYHGMEIDCWLEIISILNKNTPVSDRFSESLQAFINQNHSGMSSGAVFFGLRTFHPLGRRLVEYIKKH